MSDLDDYNARRRFMRTPEPFGAMGETDAEALRFVVQRHEAKRLHFDLRLEWGGVLRSWAVPEGPSLDPAHKRFAIATEDHPLNYLGFEGVIPDGEYGAGTLRLWDAGTWVPIDADIAAAFEAGELKFRLAGVRLTGGFMLKRLPKGDREWLLIKERDKAVVKNFEPEVPKPKRFAKPKPAGTAAKLPKKISPMLPSPVDSPPEIEGWLHEIKFDGYRTLVRKEGDNVRFFTRQGLDWTERYQALIPNIAELDCETAIIDGEVAVQDARGATSLEQLQQALSEGRDHDLVFYAFDLIHLNNLDLSGLSLIERKNWLRRLVPSDEMSRIQFSDHVEGDGRKLFAQACRLGLEGVVSKQRTSKYRQERSKSWLKAKRFDVANFAVIGFTTKSSSRHVASIILAEDTGELTYVGRAGTGLSLDETRALFQELSELEVPKASITVPKTPNAHFIKPGQFEAEISYRGRTTKNIIRQAAILDVRQIGAKKPVPRRARLITDRDLANIRLTNPDRSYDGETSKLDVALWYAKAGEWMLPHLMNRPVTLIRCQGADLSGTYYQRHGFSGLPDGVETMGDTRDEEFLVIREPRGFLGLPQFGVMEFHPWDCTVSDLDHPDRLTIDLDPGEGVDWATVVSAATAVRERLKAQNMPSFVRMTGGAGVHVVVPLSGKDDWKAAKTYQKAFSKTMAGDMPRLFTDKVSKATRKGRIYLDTNRTSFGTSAVASYSLRAREGFPAAMPLVWQDLNANLPPSEFFRKKALKRLEKMVADPWEGFDDARSEITLQALKEVGLKT